MAGTNDFTIIQPNTTGLPPLNPGCQDTTDDVTSLLCLEINDPDKDAGNITKFINNID